MSRSLLLLSLLVAVAIAAPVSALWPMPQSVTQGSGTYTVDVKTFAMKPTGVTSTILTNAISRYAAILEHGTIPGTAPAGGATGSLAALEINVKTNNQSLSLDMDESYSLTVSSPTATLTANTVFGALRGLETFVQGFYTVKGVLMTTETVISDFPRFHHRGIMIDTARHYLSMTVLKQHLDAMSYTKASVLHWHIVDDQSFPYESVKYPELAAKGAYNNVTHVYTPAQVQEVIAYARDRGIRVVVEFDTPGHTEAWGPGQPGLLTPCYDGNGKPTGTFGPINPTLNSTFDFLKGFFEEVSQTFADHYIHLGGDEVSFNCWASNPEVQAWMAKHKYTDYAQLEQYYETTLLSIINDLDRGYVVWQEIFDNGLKVRPDTVIDVWKGGWQTEIAAVTKSGLRAILSSPWYLNYISYGEDWPKYYAIEPLNFTGSDAAKKLVMGGEACLWAEFIDDTNAISRTWPRASAVIERLWSAEDVRDVTSATARLHDFRCRLLARGLAAEPPSGPSFCEIEYVPTYSPPWTS